MLRTGIGDILRRTCQDRFLHGQRQSLSGDKLQIAG
jgi:hypothetical protein